MPYEKGQPTLISYIAGIVLARGVAKKQRFGGDYIRLQDFIELLCFLYSSGAIIGRARRDKLTTLEKMLVLPVLGPCSVKSLQDQAEKRLEVFKIETGEEPDSFIKFIQIPEAEKAMGLAAFSEFAIRGTTKALDKKIPLEEAALPTESFGLEGIGFGSRFPTLTEIMYRTDYENIVADWRESKAQGLAVPEKPIEENFEKREENILKVLGLYASKYYPELLDALELRGHLEIAKEEDK